VVLDLGCHVFWLLMLQLGLTRLKKYMWLRPVPVVQPVRLSTTGPSVGVLLTGGWMKKLGLVIGSVELVALGEN
tara:strand:- start:451 stop:672 length:222 start_codon:yes stop_codon:yes gene_type:complete